MTITPNICPEDPKFPGDPSPQPPFGFRDTVRSSLLWMVGLSELVAWNYLVSIAAKITDLHRVDFILKWMAKTIPMSLGVRIEVNGVELIDPSSTYVYVANHVSIFDMFALYKAIPQYTRALEHIDHFSWPFIGSLITAAGQIPIDPKDKKQAAKSLKKAADMLKKGDSLTVLPEGARTLDGSLGPFLPGAFRLAIKQGVPVAPIAIRGGRQISRRGDWRFRPGTQQVIFGRPIPTKGLKAEDAPALALKCRQCIIDMLKEGNPLSKPIL